jgi:nucleotide-binding universal stress UspA family protein
MLRRVLLPLDAGDDDTRAVAFTRFLARHSAVEVLLLRVEGWPAVGPGGAYAWTPAARAGRLTAVRQSLGGLGAGGVRALSREAISSAAVLQKARRGEASLIVIPHRREPLWSRLLRGESSRWMLRDSPIPVLAVPEGVDLAPPAVSRILFVHGGSQTAVEGSRLAVEFSQAFEASVGVLRVPRPPTSLPRLLSNWLYGDPAAPDPCTDDVLLSLFRKRGVDVEALPAAEDPGPVVSRLVRDVAVDLVFLCRSSGPDRAADALARHVLEVLRVPLLVFRRRPDPEGEEAPPRFSLRV